MVGDSDIAIARPAHMGGGVQHQGGAGPLCFVGQTRPGSPVNEVGAVLSAKAPFSTNGERIGNCHHKRAVVAAVVVPLEAYQEVSYKENRAELLLSFCIKAGPGAEFHRLSSRGPP